MDSQSGASNQTGSVWRTVGCILLALYLPFLWTFFRHGLWKHLHFLPIALPATQLGFNPTDFDWILVALIISLIGLVLFWATRGLRARRWAIGFAFAWSCLNSLLCYALTKIP